MSFVSLSNTIFKFLIIGDSGVGKTSIVRCFCHNEFTENYKETIGVEFIPFSIEIERTPIKIQIWDTAGQEKYRALSHAYYRNAIGVILVFSYTDSQSFNNLEQWLDDVHSFCHNMAQIILVGNKLDLKEKQEISRNVAEDFAKSHKIQFIESSAKDNIGIQEVFYKLTRNICQKVLSGEIILTKNGHIPIQNNEEKNEGTCC